MHLGIDIGGSTLKAGILTNENKLLDKQVISTESYNEPQDLIDKIVNLIQTFTNSHDIEAIGIGVPGVVDNGKVIIAPNLKGWVKVPLLKELQKSIEIPISIDNDANAAALAELHLGEGKGLDNFLYITLGTGVGGAIIYQGNLFKGAKGGAGEIGHLIINAMADPKDFASEFRTGVFEEYTGRKQIVKIAEEMKPKFPDSALHNLSKFDVEHISELADKEDELAIATLEKAGFLLGIGIASAMNLLDMRTVIIGGGISQASFHLFDTLIHTIKKRALPSIASDYQIKLAEFIQETGIYGACVLARHFNKS